MHQVCFIYKIIQGCTVNKTLYIYIYIYIYIYYLLVTSYDTIAVFLTRQPLQREALDAWQKLIATSDQLEQVTEAGNREMLARVFHTMFLYMGLQLLADPKMAKDALEVCLNKLSVTVFKWLILLS